MPSACQNVGPCMHDWQYSPSGPWDIEPETPGFASTPLSSIACFGCCFNSAIMLNETDLCNWLFYSLALGRYCKQNQYHLPTQVGCPPSSVARQIEHTPIIGKVAVLGINCLFSYNLVNGVLNIGK